MHLFLVIRPLLESAIYDILGIITPEVGLLVALHSSGRHIDLALWGIAIKGAPIIYAVGLVFCLWYISGFAVYTLKTCAVIKGIVSNY